MTVIQILRDPSVRAADPREYRYRKAFVTEWVHRRLRRLILAGEADSRDESGPTNPAVIKKIAKDLALVPSAYKTIRDRIVANTNHLPLGTSAERAAIRRQVASGNLAFGNDPRLFREHAIRDIVYQATAFDMDWIIKDPPLQRLHSVAERRLRMVEMMVHRIGDRPREIRASAWGSERMFEYPEAKFAFGVNPEAAACWPVRGDPADYLEVDFTPYPDRCTCTAAEAIRQLFTPHADESQRNRFNCDHVMMALHLEALEFWKRSQNAPPGWLDDEWRAQPEQLRGRWLRIQNQFNNPDVFLGAEKERDTGANLHFRYASVPQDDLQVGDHLIVFNHPLYHYLVSGFWHNENSIVVQTVPKLVVQGHGLGPFELTVMRDKLLEKSNEVIAEAEERLTVLRYDTNYSQPPAGWGVPSDMKAHHYYEGVWFVRKYDPARFPQYRGDGWLGAWYLVWACSADNLSVVSEPRRTLIREHQYIEFTVGRDSANQQFPVAWFPMAKADDATLEVSPMVLAAANAYAGGTFYDVEQKFAVIRPGESP